MKSKKMRKKVKNKESKKQLEIFLHESTVHAQRIIILHGPTVRLTSSFLLAKHAFWLLGVMNMVQFNLKLSRRSPVRFNSRI